MKKFLLALGAISAFAFAANASDAPKVEDTNGDGFYQFEEIIVVWTDFTQAGFTTADVDADGKLTQEELDAYHATMK